MNNYYDLLCSIEEKLPNLSKGQKRIANFLLEHYDKAVYLTASRLGEIAGVSESTVVRFAIEMGFDGYPKFQRALEDHVKNKLTASQRMRVSSDRIIKNNKHILKSVLESDLEKIHSTMNNVDERDFDAVVDALLSGKKIYVLGNGIPDPYGSDLVTYRRCRRDIEQATVELCEYIKRNYPQCVGGIPSE